jgi:hypothetical protein
MEDASSFRLPHRQLFEAAAGIYSSVNDVAKFTKTICPLISGTHFKDSLPLQQTGMLFT